MSRLNNFSRKIYLRIKRKKLKNKDFTLLCNNCTGAFILHDLNVQYNSPCVNLFIEEADFIKFVKRLDYYKSQKLNFIESDKEYPVAKLDDITVYFMHYDSSEQAEKKWTERFARINKDNIFIMLHQRETCTDEILKAFDELPYKYKVAFTCKHYPQLKSTYYIANCEIDGYLDHIYLYKNPFTYKKYYDDFDYIRWFNLPVVNK